MTPHLLSTNLTDHSITIAIGSIRYEYFFANHDRLHTCEHLCLKVSPLKGLNYAKRHCFRVLKLEAVHA